MKQEKESPYWRIKRYVLEVYQVQAPTRKEAMEKCCDPAEIHIIKETCVKEKDNER
jgi:hypothetical protein